MCIIMRIKDGFDMKNRVESFLYISTVLPLHAIGRPWQINCKVANIIIVESRSKLMSIILLLCIGFWNSNFQLNIASHYSIAGILWVTYCLRSCQMGNQCLLSVWCIMGNQLKCCFDFHFTTLQQLQLV